ncbi:pyridoxal kinase PdxY [Colwellia sp. Arc7-635]|uniref:pyridoxal kinase PdxY n=1 Tax=Colwellia sp. Arc7-635 TaxID=2497879 RepID=UPI000F85A829|nr:pyridoxal kinase PdxY [Colwellia sp. Arc7-635]AZQ84410.1 pyridoxal kinase PdxY [Colwellia sp. Arc7-635]
MRGIISIQSHVVYGCAGNSAAVFPLQRLGFNVWPINTVQFSNHTQYKQGWTGTVLAQGEITSLFNGLENINVFPNISAVISGYLGGANQASEILDNIQRIKTVNPDYLYVCDPVMGDENKGCFVTDDVAEMLCKYLIPAAQVITPNQFELSQITGIAINDLDSAIAACDKACAMGPSIVLVKHLHYKSLSNYSMLMATEEGVYLIERPLIDFSIPVIGVGDLTTSLFTGNLLKTKSPIEAFEKTNQSVYDIVSKTKALAERELQIIAAQDYISDGKIEYFASKIVSY